MPEQPSKYVPAQRFVGLQVIDNKGVVVGTIKDVSIDFAGKSLAFRIATKSKAELDVKWDDVLSVEDVVLLKKEYEVQGQAPPTVQAILICPNCGASAPGHAKFCPKCGSSMK